MSHPIEHAVGLYVGLLLLACVVAITAKFITHLPYTIFLTLVGLGIALTGFGPSPEEVGISHDLIFFVFLPPLLFQGAFHMEFNRLLSMLPRVFAFAVPGVVVSTLLVGGLVWWQGGITSVLVAMLFGALISPTDPVSVLAIFRESKTPEDLRTLVEGESLFNDGTGVVLFTIFLQALLGGGGGEELTVLAGVVEFLKVSLGGTILGGVFGFLAFWILKRLDDHLLENALCVTLAYGVFWLAEYFHVSGVIATVIAGLLMGNYGRRLSMSTKTRDTVETFFESIDFLLNSFLFILMGLELREIPNEISVNPWRLVIVAIIAMLLARGIVSYTFAWVLNRLHRPQAVSWSHILFWGGLRGSIPIALLLHLPSDLPADHPLGAARPALFVAGFGCVLFSLVGQGLTMSPLIRFLRIGEESHS